jgi:hypothetical protein
MNTFYLIHVMSPVLSTYPSHGALFFLIGENTKMNLAASSNLKPQNQTQLTEPEGRIHAFYSESFGSNLASQTGFLIGDFQIPAQYIKLGYTWGFLCCGMQQDLDW